MLRSYIRQSEDSAGFCVIIGAKQLAGFVPKILSAIFFFWGDMWLYTEEVMTSLFFSEHIERTPPEILNMVHTVLHCDIIS